MSDVSLCNRALSEIGTRSTITSLDEASPEAVQCAIQYTPCRQTLLRSAHWGFARYQLLLTQLGVNSDIPNLVPYPWRYKYAYPSDCLKLRYLLAPPINVANSIAPNVGDPFLPQCLPSRANRFILASDIDGSRIILSNVPNAIGVYTRDVIDTDHMDPSFQMALVKYLAANLVIPLSGNIGQKNAQLAAVQDAVNQARVSDGNEGLSTSDHTVDWIAARGTPSDWAFGPGPNDIGLYYQGWDNTAWGD